MRHCNPPDHPIDNWPTLAFATESCFLAIQTKPVYVNILVLPIWNCVICDILWLLPMRSALQKEHTTEMTSVVFLHAEGLIHFLRFG